MWPLQPQKRKRAVENDTTLEFKYVDDVTKAVEDLMYQGHLHINIDRNLTTHVWVISYED